MAIPNSGFANALNVGVRATEAPYVLFPNPDTEIVEGTLDQLIAELESQPRLGLVGVRQIGPDGTLQFTILILPERAPLAGRGAGIGRLAAPLFALRRARAVG